MEQGVHGSELESRGIGVRKWVLRIEIVDWSWVW